MANIIWTKLSPLVKKIGSIGGPEMRLQMSNWSWCRLGEEKNKTNRQLVPIMVLLGADGPVITGLETCNCTQLWVLLSKFGEAEAEARTV